MTLRKKLLAALLIVAMVAGMSLPVLAERNTEEGAAGITPGDDVVELTTSPTTNKGEGDYTIGVNGTYVAGDNAEGKISVDIAWESMNFTYTAGDSTYSPENHTTTTTAGSWSTNKAGITVTNHSNVAIDASMSFIAGEDVTTIGTFYTKDDSDNYTAIASADDQGFTLESADGKTRNDTDASLDQSPKGTLYFGVSGDAIDEDTTLGSITVKIKKGATVVTDEATLKAALEAIKATGGTVKLGANITITNNETYSIPLPILVITLSNPENAPIILDLGSHTVTGMIIAYCDTTSKFVIQNGTVACSSLNNNVAMFGVISVQKGFLELKSVTINATDMLALSLNAEDTTVTDSELNGGVISNEKTDTVLLTGNLTLSGKVTVGGKLNVQKNKNLTLKAGCQYKINGATTATTVDEDITYIVGTDAEDLPDWIEVV